MNKLKMTKTPTSAEEEWARLSETEKQRRIVKLTKVNPILRLSGKGYKITRKKQNISDLPILKPKKDAQHTLYKEIKGL